MPGPGDSALQIQAEWEEIRLAQANPDRFRPLYERYYPQVFRFVYKRTGDEELAADITAQIFLKTLQSLGKYVFRGLPFAAWIFRIATNEVNQYYRNTNKLRVVSLDEEGIRRLAEESNDSQDKEALLVRLKALIQTLDEEDVQLLELRFFEQMPFAAVAQVLGITENNAKVRTYRLIDKLRKKMKP